MAIPTRQRCHPPDRCVTVNATNVRQSQRFPGAASPLWISPVGLSVCPSVPGQTLAAAAHAEVWLAAERNERC